MKHNNFILLEDTLSSNTFNKPTEFTTCYKNKKHEIDRENSVILDFYLHCRRRKTEEALVIDCQNIGADISPNGLTKT